MIENSNTFGFISQFQPPIFILKNHSSCQTILYKLFHVFVSPTPSFVTLIPSFLPLFQAQAGWLQHDFGHLSVFKSRTLNHIAHHFLIGHLKVCGRSFLGSMVELF